MKRPLTALIAFMLAFGTTPQNIGNLSFNPGDAFARPGGHGGFSRPSGGARP